MRININLHPDNIYRVKITDTGMRVKLGTDARKLTSLDVTITDGVPTRAEVWSVNYEMLTPAVRINLTQARIKALTSIYKDNIPLPFDHEALAQEWALEIQRRRLRGL